MNRVRYYKINGHVVWDKTKKFDILTGSEIQIESTNGMFQNFSRTNGDSRRGII
jgi:hypothetical protein